MHLVGSLQARKSSLRRRVFYLFGLKFCISAYQAESFRCHICCRSSFYKAVDLKQLTPPTRKSPPEPSNFILPLLRGCLMFKGMFFCRSAFAW